MTQLSTIKLFTTTLIRNLSKLGIMTLQDLVLHMPLRYQDETRVTLVRDLRVGDMAQVEGEITHTEVTYKPRKTLVSRLEDASGQLILRFLNFYPSQIAMLRVGKKMHVFGEIRSSFFGFEMVHPQVKVVSEVNPKSVPETLTPIYPTTAGLTQNVLRKWITYSLNKVDLAETLPSFIYLKQRFPSFAESVNAIHNPLPDADLDSLEKRTTPEWKRLAFDELLAQQLYMRKHYTRRRTLNSPQLKPSKILITALLKSLPFTLTQAQQKVAIEIESDLTKKYPMQRLLQGDVGSGKTIVACMSALQAIENNYQAAIMAPTEILAEQHYRKMLGWLTPINIKIAWLTGSQSKKEHDAALADIAEGTAELVIGTHALFQEQVKFKKLGLAIIDEQHRFGVQQRLALRQKGHPAPHQLMMTATPIPRTLSMSYFADLDLSIIDELPPGRTPVVTKLVHNKRRDDVVERVRAACNNGAQAYWVCPLIDESETLQLQTAEQTFVTLTEALPELRVGLVHGRMKPAEKQAVMVAFSENHIQLLIATTVIEVGVDVPNASLMVIEHAERMGLSQLHQLRGRVGRGSAKSSCILLYQKPSETARERLKVIYEHSDGFLIAQADLNLRGPGEFLGVRQSGVPMLKIADLSRDAELITAAQAVTGDLLNHHPVEVEAHLNRWLGEIDGLVKV